MGSIIHYPLLPFLLRIIILHIENPWPHLPLRITMSKYTIIHFAYVIPLKMRPLGGIARQTLLIVDVSLGTILSLELLDVVF